MSRTPRFLAAPTETLSQKTQRPLPPPEPRAQKLASHPSIVRARGQVDRLRSGHALFRRLTLDGVQADNPDRPLGGARLPWPSPFLQHAQVRHRRDQRRRRPSTHDTTPSVGLDLPRRHPGIQRDQPSRRKPVAAVSPSPTSFALRRLATRGHRGTSRDHPASRLHPLPRSRPVARVASRSAPQSVASRTPAVVVKLALASARSTRRFGRSLIHQDRTDFRIFSSGFALAHTTVQEAPSHTPASSFAPMGPPPPSGSLYHGLLQRFLDSSRSSGVSARQSEGRTYRGTGGPHTDNAARYTLSSTRRPSAPSEPKPFPDAPGNLEAGRAPLRKACIAP